MESSGDSGGMVFNVPMKNVKELGPIFSIMNKMIEKGGSKPMSGGKQKGAGSSMSEQEKMLSQMKMSEVEKFMEKLRALVSDVGVS